MIKSEYLVLLLSIIAICVNVYIARRNRKHSLEKEIYFKYQKIAEKIIAKLLILENQKEKFMIWIKHSHTANTIPWNIFIDNNEAFDKSNFEKNSDEIAALIQIYFPELGGIRSDLLTQMGDMLRIIIILREKIKKEEAIKWDQAISEFNLKLEKIWDKPKEMSDKIIDTIKQFRKGKMK